MSAKPKPPFEVLVSTNVFGAPEYQLFCDFGYGHAGLQRLASVYLVKEDAHKCRACDLERFGFRLASWLNGKANAPKWPVGDRGRVAMGIFKVEVGRPLGREPEFRTHFMLLRPGCEQSDCYSPYVPDGYKVCGTVIPSLVWAEVRMGSGKDFGMVLQTRAPNRSRLARIKRFLRYLEGIGVSK